MAPLIGRWLEGALSLAVIVACLIVLHKSANFVGRAPALNVDDSIPNVSVTLAERGRYGFLASPTQGFTKSDRTRGFYNYGPLYFYVGSALTWVLTPSVTLFRMLHPAGIAAIVLLSLIAFRRASLAGAAVVAVALFSIYLESHWPLARPDIMVSVCAALMFVSAAHAIDRASVRSWMAVGFFAASAATTHQLAMAVVPASAIILVWSLAERRQADPAGYRRYAVRSLLALTAGGVLGGLVYLAAISFRIEEIWSLGSGAVTGFAQPYRQALSTHFNFAWGQTHGASFRLLVVLFLGSGIASLAAIAIKGAASRMVLALVMPAVVVSTAYQLSVGLYGNFHTGYVILSQVATVWAAGALVSVLVWWLGERLPSRSTRIVSAAMLSMAILWLVRVEASWLRTAGLWERQAAANVDIDEYAGEVMSVLPERASVWGSLYFGLLAGDRLDLVQFLEVLGVALNDFTERSRSTIAPDFLLLSHYETDTDFTRYLAGHDSYIQRFHAVFSPAQYDAVRLVYAPPYGVTHTYRRRERSSPAPTIADHVAVNDGVSRQWSSALSEPLAVRFEAAEPVVASVDSYNVKSERRSVAALTASLESGFYVIDVELSTPADRLGFLLASSGSFFYWRGGWTRGAIPAGFYLPHDTGVKMLVDHAGGPLFLGRFENLAAGGPPQRVGEVWTDPPQSPEYGMRVRSVRRVQVLNHAPGGVVRRPLPSWSNWSPQSTSTDVKTTPDGGARIHGNPASGAHLLASPSVSVPKGQRLVVTIPTHVVSGTIDVGLRDRDGTWAAAPVQMPQRVAFDAMDDTSVTIVVTNSSFAPAMPVDVRLGAPTLELTAPDSLYVDRLMRCRAFGGDARPPECAARTNP